MRRITTTTGLGILALLTATAAAQTPVSTAFTYQGQLKDNNAPAGGTYDLRFRLFNAATLGSPVGSPDCVDGVTPVDGLFTVELDFGATPFVGDARWLEVEVRSDTTPANCSTGVYTLLSNRQPLTAVPYAMYALGGAGAFWTASGTAISNSNTGFVGVKRSAPVSGAEYFGIQAPVASGYGGMYVRTDGPSALPFYGYKAGPTGETAWTYLDGASGDWRVNVDGDRMTVTSAGEVGIGTTTPASALHIVGAENNGIDAALRVVAGAQTLLLDGNEIDSLDSVGLYLNNNVSHKMVLANGGGNVGIGVTSPQARLDVLGPDDGNASTSSYAIRSITSDPQGFAGVFRGVGGTGPALWAIGSVQVGATDTPVGVKLSVDGKILCEELEVQLSGDWPDYVFEDDYDLMPLSEVSEFIQREKHLPGIPSAAEVKREGVAVGQMQSDVLRKVEELTLHMIDLDKKVRQLQDENDALRARLATAADTDTQSDCAKAVRP